MYHCFPYAFKNSVFVLEKGVESLIIVILCQRVVENIDSHILFGEFQRYWKRSLHKIKTIDNLCRTKRFWQI